MNNLLFQIYRILIPKPIRTALLKTSLRKKIPAYYASLPGNMINEEQREILKYLENNPVRIFPYPFQDNYSPEKINVIYDQEKGMRYVFQDGKKLYFKRSWSDKRIRRAYADLSREQDTESPHRYLNADFALSSEDIIVDVGAAEGNFSLSVIELVRKVFLIEYEKEWMEALEATFSPWKDKVVITSKYASDIDDEINIKLDTLLKDNPDISFLKIDVDGFEQKVLNGFMEVISGSKPLKIALCTYHKNDDERDFSLLFQNYGFTVTPSKGYMIHYYDKKITSPYLRRGLIRAIR